MINFIAHRKEVHQNGFTVIEDVFTEEEVASLISVIENTDSSNPTFRKTSDLFAIRQFLKGVPETISHIFNEKMHSIIEQLFRRDYAIVKSIYFDKPEASNWFVSYHQDLTISVDRKVSAEGFSNWSVKQNQFAVQPPLHILENIFTIRIHLDDTDGSNGALRVVPCSHRKGIYRPETINWEEEKEVTCSVPKGGVMIMKPLLLHASSRTTSNKRRRVIHFEFSSEELPSPPEWSERISIQTNRN